MKYEIFCNRDSFYTYQHSVSDSLVTNYTIRCHNLVSQVLAYCASGPFLQISTFCISLMLHTLRLYVLEPDVQIPEPDTDFKNSMCQITAVTTTAKWSV